MRAARIVVLCGGVTAVVAAAPDPTRSLDPTRALNATRALGPTLALDPTPGPPRSLSLEPCDWRGVEGRVECGTLRVPEDRGRADSPADRRALSLFFVVARATGEAAAEPVFFFTGGPGSAASLSAPGLTRMLWRLRQTRDFVFIDQRGTGRSAPLECSGLQGLRRRLRPMFDRAEAAACRDALDDGADLRFYTTADAVQDVDDVRMALGYRRINLHGSSYGTRAAWAYAARYPSRARAMVLHGPAPPGLVVPLPFARALDAALDGVIAACADDAPCAARFPTLEADVARAFARLRSAPVTVRVGDVGGPLVDAPLTHGELTEAVRYQLYSPAGAARLPSLLTSAAKGDYAPIANAAVEMRGRLAREVAQGMYLSVTCAEDIPLITPEATRAATAGTRLGDYRVRQQIEACREWPRAIAASPPGAAQGPQSAAGPPAAANLHVAARLDIPALVQVGEFDPATPVEAARRALDLLPNGRLVIVPHGGHALGDLGIGPCLTSMITTFMTEGSARGLDTSCVNAARRPPFTLR